MHKQLLSLILFLVIVTTYAKSVHKARKDEGNQEQYYNPADFDVVYDRKQNATEDNYSLDVSGIRVIVAPPTSLLSAFAFSPLSLLDLVAGFSKRSASLALKNNFGIRRKENLEVDNVIDVSTESATTSKDPEDVVEKEKTPLKDFTKNFEEKIQVQELIPGFKGEKETKISSEDPIKPDAV